MKIIKNLVGERLSKDELKQVKGGTAPHCYTGKICYRGENDKGELLWDCVPLTTECKDFP